MILNYEKKTKYGAVLLYPVGKKANELCKEFGYLTVTDKVWNVAKLLGATWELIPDGMLPCGVCYKARFNSEAKCPHCGD